MTITRRHGQPITRYVRDGEAAIVSLGQTKLMVYARDVVEGPHSGTVTYSIGRPDYDSADMPLEEMTFRDLAGQTGFLNQRAAIDQARWLVTEPDILKDMWW